MNSHCDDMIPALVRAADGGLEALQTEERARLQAHLSTCASCTEALADQTQMRQALASLAEAPVQTLVGGRVMATLRADARASTWLESLDWKRWTWRLAPVAAGLAIAVATLATGTTPASVLIEPETAVEAMPVSSALVTGDVGGDDMLSLLLNSTADATLSSSAGGAQ